MFSKKLVTAFFFVSLWCLFNSVYSYASELKFRQYKQDNGLSANTVYCIFQDSRGYIWVGTSDGLNRFNSKSFDIYRYDKQNPHSIGNNSIYSIIEDDDQNLWIGTQHGVYLYNPRTDRFAKIELSDVGAAPGNLLVYSMSRAKNGDIWLSTLGNGLFKYESKTKKIKHYKATGKKNSIFSDFVSKVIVDEKGDVWVIAGEGILNKFDPKTNGFIRIPIYDKKNSIGMQNAFDLCEDSFGNLWITGRNCGIFKYEKSSGVFTNYLTKNGKPLIENRIHTVMEWEPGKLMLGSDEGLIIFNSISNTFERVSYDPLDSRSLSDHFVYRVIKDREGGLWVGTYWGGVNYCSQYNYNFSLYKFTPNKNSISGRVISKFIEDKEGQIWIGMDDAGLNKFNPVTKRFERIIVDPQEPNLNIHALYIDGDELWIGSHGRGLYRMNIKTGKVLHYFKDTASGLDDPNIYSIYKDSAGKLWIGTKRSINIFNYETNDFTCLVKLTYNCDVLDIKEDQKGVLWFTSLGKGVISYQPKRQKIKFYSKYDGNAGDIPTQTTTLCFDNERLWVGTVGDGLWYYERSKDKFVKEKVSQLFNENASIYHIISDHGDLWMTTNEGLIKYNPRYKNANYYNIEDGLQGNLFNPNSGLRAANGEIYLGGNNGFNVFLPHRLPDVSKKLHIVFTQLEHFNKPVSIGENSILQSSIDNQRSIKLKNRNSVFSIEFIALSFNAPSRIKYRYMLEGFDKEWVYTKNNSRKATYTNLSPGHYRLRVMASDNSEWQLLNEAIVDVTILPDWWMTKPFIILFVVLVLIILSLCYWMILNRGMKQQHAKINQIQLDREHKLTKEKMSFFNSIAHEIRTPATLISIPVTEIMKMSNIPVEIREDLGTIQRNSDRLLNLINQILDFNRLEHHTLKSFDKTDINQLVHDTLNQFISISKTKNIVINVNAQEKLIAWVDQEAVTKILSNLVVNALKYTTDRVDITIETTGSGYFQLSVSDNGQGIEKEKLDKIFSLFYHTFQENNLNFTGFGVGLAIVSLMVKKIDAEISVDSLPGSYTVFKVKIPINQSDKNSTDEITQATPAGDGILPTLTLSDFNTTKKATILIVEDNEELLNCMCKVLKKEYLIIAAKNGNEAVTKLEQDRIDLVVSDVLMPGMTGFELCKYVKSSEDLNHIPIILLSAIVNLDSKIKGLEFGADVYVDKPISIDYLSAQITSLLERRDNFRVVFSKAPFKPIHSIPEKTVEKAFLYSLNEVVERNMMNSEFSIEDITTELNVSRTVLYNKTKSMTGMTPLDFVRLVRLRKAAEYLSSKKYKINEVCYMVGFSSPSYFSKCFYTQFKKLPKDFQNGD